MKLEIEIEISGDDQPTVAVQVPDGDDIVGIALSVKDNTIAGALDLDEAEEVHRALGMAIAVAKRHAGLEP